MVLNLLTGVVSVKDVMAEELAWLNSCRVSMHSS